MMDSSSRGLSGYLSPKERGIVWILEDLSLSPPGLMADAKRNGGKEGNPPPLAREVTKKGLNRVFFVSRRSQDCKLRLLSSEREREP